LQLEVAREVVQCLEMAGDRRALAEHEESLRKLLKCKSMGLTSLQRSMARQESRLLLLKEGDALTKFFHSYANMRRRKKHIQFLEHNGQVLIAEEAKAEAIFSFFDEILGTPPADQI
jgi:hypothetical protein